MRLAPSLLLRLLPLALAGCATPSLPTEGVPAPGDYVREYDGPGSLDGRLWCVHVPRGYDGRKPLPLLVVLHGVFTSARGMAAESGFGEVADAEGFLVVYPQATKDGLARMWNSGHIQGKAWEAKVDDVGFLERVIADARGRFEVDPDRIFMVGHSNGGMMALRFAAERPGVLAGVASVGGTVGGRPNDAEPEWRVPVPTDRVPALFIHGREDVTIPYRGGESDRGKNGWTCVSHQDSAEFWAKALGMEAPPALGRKCGQRVWCQTWGTGEVTALTLEGWEHAWPGKAAMEDLDEKDGLREFDAARIVWEFFRERKRILGGGK